MIFLLASALPKVEDPIPDTIGLDTVFAIAGAGGVLGTILGSFEGLRSRKHSRDWWTSAGLIGGFYFGAGVYLVALMGQVLS